MSLEDETLQAHLTLLKAKTAELVSGLAAKRLGLHGPVLHSRLDELERTLQHARAAAVSAGHRKT